MRYNVKNSFSLYLHVAAHILSDVERTALPHLYRTEFRTVIKRALSDLHQRAGEHYLPDTAAAETLFADVLYAVRDLDILEILTTPESPGLDPLQRGGKFDALYRALRENTANVLFPLDGLCLT